ncbi:MAG: hypothetical protein A2481_00585 [Candidatus Yonathbacteria bacterium RIFOXYC2_FULL_47_9]|nr:MAG: hypothetical protein A2481_00585 [Candidatus Yonathbacteria bacterium RIFOXYC2_FULL_47_9]HAT68133.1 hypothetical protein [Candidatus Yonathbacteria bacterium]
MESKGKRRDRKIGAFLLTTVILLVIGLYIPLIIQGIKASSSVEYSQVTHGVITTAPEFVQVIPTAVTEVGSCEYVIKKGDTLTKIAKHTNDTIRALAKRNSIKNVNRIFAGKSIILKNSNSCMAVSKTSSKKFTGHHAGASQKTLFTKTHSSESHESIRAKTTAHKNVNCLLVGARIKNKDDRLIARAECVRKHYGSIIVDAVKIEGNKFSALEILAIILQESQGDPRAVSKARVPCLGLMQLQPPTAQQYGVKSIFDPRENIFGGVRVFTDYVYRYGKGDKSYGLAAYNMGPTGLRNSGLDPGKVPYVRDVKAILRILEDRQFVL